MELNFKNFIVESHEKFMKDAEGTLSKLPKAHRDLIKNYTFEKQIGNTLKGDGDHVGVIDEKNKKITIAAPWSYSRSFTFLHEVAHAVYKYKMTPESRKEWSDLIKKTKKDMPKSDALNQNDEEIFCHCYANYYVTHKVMTYYNEKLMDFIKNLPH